MGGVACCRIRPSPLGVEFVEFEICAAEVACSNTCRSIPIVIGCPRSTDGVDVDGGAGGDSHGRLCF